MQGMNWVSKELKKSFITFKLDEINQNILKSIEIAQIIYLVAMVDAYFNNKSWALIVLIVSLILFQFIKKNLEIIKEKSNKIKAERALSLPDIQSENQYNTYDSLSVNNVIQNLDLKINQRALSVDFNMQFMNRFDEKRQQMVITDKRGIEAKSSLNTDLHHIKTSNNYNELISDASIKLSNNFNQQESESNNRESMTDLDSMLLGSKSPEIAKTSNQLRFRNKKGPGNLQNSSGALAHQASSEISDQSSMFSFGRKIKSKIYHRRFERYIQAPVKLAAGLFKTKDRAQRNIYSQDVLGILFFIIFQSIYIISREYVVRGSLIMVFPISFFYVELLHQSIYTPIIKQSCCAFSSIMMYQQNESFIENICLFGYTLGTLYLSILRLKYLEDTDYTQFENTHMLQSSKNLIEQIFNTVPDGIGVIDFTGTSFSNKIFTDLIGDPSNPDSFFKNLKQFIREGQNNQGTAFTLFEDLKIYHKNILSQNRQNSLASESREYFTVQQTQKNKNSKIEPRKYYMIFMSKIIFEGKVCLLLTMRDVTNQKVIQEKKLVDEVKNRIFKSFTHELKNPLNFLLFSFELINKHIIDLKTNPYAFKNLKSVVSTAESCTNVLKNIINDFIDYSMLCSSSGQLQLSKQEFDLDSFITRIEKTMINQLKSQNVVFRVSRDPDLPKIIYSDPEKLEQILLNLLLNAQKFTQKGWIKFKIMKYQTKKIESGNDKDDFHIRFMVLDTGNGIEKERVQTIFNLFEQNQTGIGKESLQNKKSAGLGLTISQNLCIALGGQIRCKSELAQGSVFYFDIKYTLEKDLQKSKSLNPNDLNSAQMNRVISPNGYSIQDEDKIEENEAVYMYKTQIGKFNTTFDQNDIPIDEVDQDEFNYAKNFSGLQNKFTNLGPNQNQLNLGIHTIPEHLSEQSQSMSFKLTNNDNRRNSDQYNSIMNHIMHPEGSVSNQNPAMQMSSKTACFEEEKQSRAQKNYENANLKIKKIIQNDKNYSFTGLKDLVSNPDLFELQFREEENIVQIKWSKNQKIGQIMSDQENKFFQANDSEAQQIDRNRQQLAMKNMHTQFYAHQQSTLDQPIKKTITAKKSEQMNEQILREAQLHLGQANGKKLNLKNVIDGSNEDIIQESKESFQFGEQDQSNLNTGRTLDSLDEHIKIDIIGDYAKLLGRERHQQMNNNSSYYVQKRKLIQTQHSQQCEPKESHPIKNPFNYFENIEENMFMEEEKSIRRSSSMNKLRQENINSKLSSQLLLTIPKNHQDNLYFEEEKYDMRKMKVKEPNAFKLINSQNPSFIPSGKESSQNSARQLMIDDCRESSIIRKKNHSLSDSKIQKIEIQKTIEESKDDGGKIKDQAREFNSMGTNINHFIPKPYLEKDDQASDINNINDFLGDGSIYNHPLAHESNAQNLAAQEAPQNQDYPYRQQQNQIQVQQGPSIQKIKNNCCAEIMIVDDIDYNRYILVQVIQTLFGLDCIQACNGQDCIDQVEELDSKTCCRGLRLIIMDYEMPILNGLEAARILCQKMNSNELVKKIPIVALTAYNDEKQKCLGVGMKRFLTKPAKSDELRGILMEIATGKL